MEVSQFYSIRQVEFVFKVQFFIVFITHVGRGLDLF